MIRRALSIIAVLASTTVFAALSAPPTGSSATVTPVPNITFGQTLLSDPPASAAKALTASNAQPAAAPASTAKPETIASAPKPAASEPSASEPSGTKKDEGGWSEKNLSDVLMLVFTGLLALFTFLLWISTKALWEETKKAGTTAKTAAEAAKTSAAAAETSATATLLSVEASIAAQQPRWFVKDMQLLSISISDYPRSITSRSVMVTLVNHGSSAAEVLRTEMRYCLSVTPHGGTKPQLDLSRATPMDFNNPDREFGHVTKSGEVFTFSQPTGFDDGTLTGLEAGTMEYFVVGTLQYRDYLDRTWEHSFVGVLDPKRMNVRNPPNTGQAAESPFVQPLPGPDTDPFTYTRRIDVTDQSSA